MNHLTSVSAWIEEARKRSPMLDNDADALLAGIASLMAQSRALAQTQNAQASIGLYGQSQAAKAYLLSALGRDNGRLSVPVGSKTLDWFTHINPGHQATRMALRFSPGAAIPDDDFPLRLRLISEAELVQLFIAHAQAQGDLRAVDRPVIEARLHAWKALRQPQSVPGLDAADVAAIARFWRSQVPAARQHIDDSLWYQFAHLLPSLDLSARASAWSLLWGEQQELTHQWLALAHVLHLTGHARELAAPLSLLVDQFALPADGFLTVDSACADEVVVHPWTDNQLRNAISLPVDTLSLLTCELILPLESGALESVDILDIPASAASSHPTLWQSKCGWLLDRYRQHLEPDVLVICNATRERAQTPVMAKALRQWVDETQPEQESALPGLVWAITPQDDRFSHKRNLDEAVQQLLGNPGQRWGTLQALDSGSVQRLREWLAQATAPTLRAARLEKLDQRYQQRLNELMRPCLQPEENAEAMVRELQLHAAAHGELLDGMLPDLSLFEAIWQAPTPREEKVTGLFDQGIDLFSRPDEQADAQSQSRNVGHLAHAMWVKHLRQWSRRPENARRFGLNGLILQQLAECLIVTSYRLDLPARLQAETLQGHVCAARLQTLIGNFIAWLGYSDVPPPQRPASRIAGGSAVFAGGEIPGSARLNQLPEQPVHAATRYVYDWLVALYTRATENKGYQPAQALSAVDRQQLREWLN